MSRKLLLLMLLALLIGTLNLASRVEKAEASGTIYIRADGSVDPPTANITTFDNSTYTFTGSIYDEIDVERSNIIVDGDGYALQGAGALLTNSNGIYLYGISNVSIKNLEIKSFKQGILLNSTSFSVLSQNTITDNLQGVGLWQSSNNSISDNSARFWSDYTGVDTKSGQYQNETKSDGIGDTEYAIDASNTDRYPLMGMFSDINASSEHHVQTICNSTIIDFQFNGTTICFNVTGESGTTGFCRICIPTALMNATYKVYVNSTEIAYTLLPCSNENYAYLYFNYTHSTEQVTIMPVSIIPHSALILHSNTTNGPSLQKKGY